MAWHLLRSRWQGPLELDATGVIRTRIMLGDIDFYPEFNNGRYLTLLDLGRLHLASRTGLLRVAHRNKWNFFVAGASVRYRHRVPFLSRVTMATRVLGQDGRWFYFQQIYSRKGRPCFNALIRAGLKNNDGIVPVEKILEAMGRPGWNPELPGWVHAWAKADAELPWPPEGFES